MCNVPIDSCQAVIRKLCGLENEQITMCHWQQ